MIRCGRVIALLPVMAFVSRHGRQIVERCGVESGGWGVGELSDSNRGYNGYFSKLRDCILMGD
jgi:hypothetical protein